MTATLESHNFTSRLNTAAVELSGSLLERGFVPDILIRMQIRRLLAQRLREETRSGVEDQSDYLRCLIALIRSSPIAIDTASANEQHYEVPARFFELTLGRRLKYSSGLWAPACRSLPDRRRPAHPRTRLRMGVTYPLARRTLS